MKDFPISAEENDNAILLKNVSVGYRIPNEITRSFKQYAISWLTRKIVLNTFMALKGVDLQIRRGEIFGLIGHNGAGKSTLLKLIARVLKPSEGRIIVRGKVAPLLGIGAGFHPELTGRENIFLNGAILGMNQGEMEEKIDQIINFADLGSFIEAPMRTYSSGMWSRLGFAVATSAEPEILVIDEVLAVGDENFQRKSADRIQSFCEQGVTVIIASHSMRLISELCQRVAWLDHGIIKLIGEPKQIIKTYRQSQKKI
jgi:ABC-2 type transport system ATP-binding protein/lipopolysaccharide transport system ATP-binding protein